MATKKTTDPRARFRTALAALAKEDLGEGQRDVLLLETGKALAPDRDVIVRNRVADLPEARRELAERIEALAGLVRQGVDRMDVRVELIEINHAFWTVSNVDYNGQRQCRICAKIVPPTEATDWPEPDLCPACAELAAGRLPDDGSATEGTEDHDATTDTTDGEEGGTF